MSEDWTPSVGQRFWARMPTWLVRVSYVLSLPYAHGLRLRTSCRLPSLCMEDSYRTAKKNRELGR